MGLGNQMFQYAAGRALSLHLRVPLKVYTHSYTGYALRKYELEKYFDIHPAAATAEDMAKFTLAHPVRRAWNRIFPANKLRGLPYEEKKAARLVYDLFYLVSPPHTRPVYEERFFQYDTNFFKATPPVFLKGYWMSYKYFADYAAIIRNDFTIRPACYEQVKQLGEEIRGCESVGLHIRCTDRKEAKNLKLYGEIPAAYYAKAIRHIQAQGKNNLQVYVFSDDVEKAAGYIPNGFPVTFVSGHFTKDPIEDFYLMTQCNNLVMTNSSFSWWAAYLNNRENAIIVAPARWYNEIHFNYNDIYYPQWARIEN